jgi:hypothetical protein
MQAHAERLAEANACHDADPTRAAQLLRDVDAGALATSEWPLLAFLLNHVLGEKLGSWPEAHARLGSLLARAGDAAPAVLLRQAAVAAGLAAEPAAAARAVAGLARCCSVGRVQAQELVQLASAGFVVPGAEAERAGRVALAATAALDAPHWQVASALDTPAGAACNNIAADLSERAPSDLKQPVLREALMRAALCSQRLWLRAGTWVNHERACYGLAVAAGAIGDMQAALSAAEQGLALLDQHDTAREESVDRAFLELEKAFSSQCLGHTQDAAASRARADALAAAFDDASLSEWYQQRLARHRQLLAA